MRLLVALGGNALLERGEPPDAFVQEHHVAAAVQALEPVVSANQVVVTHGNGPQVGVLAVESESDPALSRGYPLDVLVAQTQGMIGYWLARELGNLTGKPAVALVSQVVVDSDDPAFAAPSKFVGQTYDAETARRLAASRHWRVAPDGAAWRRVVPSPRPLEVVGLASVEALLQAGTTVVCGGGGGIPVVRGEGGLLEGVEAVVDKDRSSALLAELLGAEMLVLLTDVAAVEDGFGTPGATPIAKASLSELRAMTFPAGSMGPKVEAACAFVEATGRPAVIGRLEDAGEVIAGSAGTLVTA